MVAGSLIGAAAVAYAPAGFLKMLLGAVLILAAGKTMTGSRHAP
jgi:uncharacterized membrane protein YfcA